MTTNFTIVPSNYDTKRLPPNLPDVDCEPGIVTLPLGNEPHLPTWQPDIPDHYLQMSDLQIPSVQGSCR